MVSRLTRGALLLLAGLCSPTFAAQITVAAAANIKFALDDIAKAYHAQSPNRVRLVYGSSGNLISQIKHGAPFEILLAADDKYIEQLRLDLPELPPAIPYAIGQLALVVPKHKAKQISLDPELQGIKQALADGQLKRFVIANPEHAPYGERAKEYLEAKQLWSPLTAHFVYGENASQAAQFAASGSTDAGIAALSLLKAPQFSQRVSYLPLPSDAHGSLSQSMVLLPKASASAQDFYQYLQSKPAHVIFAHYGFSIPNLATPPESSR